ncbi:hypothetical protein ACIRRH_11650 [Kitasatospora sp. NPDC101235]|uniref:aromatic-ring hydroxylase C-terminal domain-containing protein n=1 Tax=Kitasatospora sp. NPDC101235 TaxID=3364101 RepID=UPI0038040CDE
MARQVIDVSLANSRARTGYRIDDELLLTAAYRSTAVLADPADPERPQLDPEHEHPDGAPGTRLPHLRLAGPPGAASTLDLVGPGFTLFTAREDAGWQRQADTATAARLPVTVHSLSAPGWSEASGLPAATGALLVRPDGHIAWRSAQPPTGDGQLLAALRRVLSAEQGAVRTAQVPFAGRFGSRAS